jgi:disulfide bond formation protein DsbB
MRLPTLTPRRLWILLAIGCFALVAGSFALTAWMDLHPCHLCIFQRLLFMLLVPVALLAGWRADRSSGRLAGLLALPLASGGAGVASYQSWLQAQPPGSISCMAGEPGLIERLVEWLGQQFPALFLATGFCEEAELRLLHMTLANWALVAFIAFLVAAASALWLTRHGTLN